MIGNTIADFPKNTVSVAPAIALQTKNAQIAAKVRA